MRPHAWEELEAGVDFVRQSPADGGAVKLIVRRPAIGEREVLQAGLLDLAEGLVGETWKARGGRSTPHGSSDPQMQLTLMNARIITPGVVRVGDRARKGS